jgi:hypothetical protein
VVILVGMTPLLSDASVSALIAEAHSIREANRATLASSYKLLEERYRLVRELAAIAVNCRKTAIMPYVECR